jgi:hypothetical protein
MGINPSTVSAVVGEASRSVPIRPEFAGTTGIPDVKQDYSEEGFPIAV